MVVREFVINGTSVRLNYSPDFYRQVAEIAGQAVTPKMVQAITRAHAHLFPQLVRVELVKEDLRTLRYVPVFSQSMIDFRLNWISIKPFFKCPNCPTFYPTKEQAIACNCQKQKTVKNK